MLNRPMGPNNFNISESQAQQEVQQILQQNKPLAQKFQTVMQNNPGRSYWDIAMSLAKERGIDLNQILRLRR
jgi:hypothetical protein